MKEIERQEVVRRIQNDIQEQDELRKQYEQLQEMAANPAVVKYLQLIEDIESKENHQQFFDSEEKMINLEFTWAFESRIKGEDMSPCYHGVWLYEGSYYLSIDSRGEHDHEFKTNDENHPEFCYNRYVCLECGKKVETKNWEKFEDDHFVLKNQNADDNLGASYYRNLYYQLLYEHTVETAQQKVIEKFYKNLEVDEQKALKKKVES